MIRYVVLWIFIFSLLESGIGSSNRPSRQITFDVYAPELTDIGTAGVLQSLKSDEKWITNQIGLRSITNNQLDEEGTRAFNRLEDIVRFEENLIQNDVRVQPNTPSFSHVKIFQPSPDAKQLAQDALVVIEATRQLQQRFNLTSMESGFGLAIHSTRQTTIFPTCRSEPPCMQHFGNGVVKYRTIDGSCNNLEHTSWGMSKTTFQRILPPAYSDGVFAPRSAIDGSSLPSARIVSLTVVTHDDTPRIDLSLMLMVFGQFIDHDITLAPIFVLPDSSGIQCCTENGMAVLPEHLRHPQCLPIVIPDNDPFYRMFNQHCMNFVRTTPGLRPDCNFGYAEQLNELTHWLDGSQIYGSDAETMTKLRDFRQGRLKSARMSGREIVPLDPKSNVTRPEDCNVASCYLAGDVRVTEQPQLTVIHTLWLREHNRIAAQLAILNPNWNDEIIFQETRRIVIAEYQFIIYNEFLPIILGERYMNTQSLNPNKPSYYGSTGDYDAKIDPSIHNEFATAAYRMGHSLIQGIVKLFNSNGQLNQKSSFPLSGVLGGVSPFGKDPIWMDEAIRGLLEQPIQNFDSSFTPEVTNKLFRVGKPFGLDLVSLNIQRGRDHGIPGYNSYREACGMKKATQFRDFLPEISIHMITRLKQVYRSVDDVDLFVGGVLETPVRGALVGPTFACIIGDQFSRLKKADRFFYDLTHQLHSFNERQMNEIRKASLARIICDNSDGTIRSIQPSVLRTAGAGNTRKRCDGTAIPQLDLSLWAGEPVF